MKGHTHSLFGVLLAAALGSVLGSSPALAANQEPAALNLGLTSFFDGFARPDPGFVYLNYALYSMSRSINDNNNKALPIFNNPKIDAFVFANQIVYVTPVELFGGIARPGFSFLWPTVIAFKTSFDPAPPPPGVQLTDNGVGVGDLIFGSFLQFKPIVADGRPVFSHRFAFDLIVPIGSYDPSKDINQSSGFTSINPYWAFTVLPIRGLEFSARLHYLYNLTNHSPAGIPPVVTPAVVSAQAGQAAWANFTVSYEVIDRLHVGANGYYFKQFTDDQYTYADGTKNNGAAVPALGETGQAQLLSIGPGLFWDVGKEDKLFANVYFALLADNRPSSNVFNLHYIHDF
jgi:hypothetical protein